MDAATGPVGTWVAERVAGGPDFLMVDVLGSDIWRWVAFAGTILLMLALRYIVKRPLISALRRLAERTTHTADSKVLDAVHPPVNAVWWVFTFFVALQWLDWPVGWASATHSLFRAACIMAIGWALFRASDLVVFAAKHVAGRTESDFDDRLVPFFGHLWKLAVVIITLVVVMQEFGFNVAAIIGALGVGSLAVALAAENMFANWFGALMIYTDQPFKKGDWVKTDDVEGFVEDVGLRSTRVRTFQKTLVHVPNSKIAANAIENLSVRPRRRVYYTLSVDLSSSPDMIDEAVQRISDVIASDPGVEDDTFTVRFTEIAESGYELLILYWTMSTDYAEYLEVKQGVHLAILRSLEEIGVRPAVPRRLVMHMNADEETKPTATD